ncbi:MAG: choline TMA-lyase-activating enzyme [Lachnospiraceae bacterium]|nr:choline TMA-lyase-activating enzyme [Lachnospiraceae bacterium]
MEENTQKTVLISNIQKFNMYDGPGVRTIVFFKGCPLRCKWCANPESIRAGYQVLYSKDLCNHCGNCVHVCPKNIHSMEGGKHKVKRNNDCIGCRSCADACPPRAIEISGKQKTIGELLQVIKEDAMFYEMSGGGLTLSGGECTMQSTACRDLLKASKEEGINTAIETSGFTKPERMLEIAKYVDFFLYDIKHMDPVRHKELTGVSNDLILQNLKELLHRGCNLTVRMPILKGINDDAREIQAVVNFLKPYKDKPNFQGIHLLPYHRLGVNKYQQLEQVYQVVEDPSISPEEIGQIETWIRAAEIKVKTIRH